MLLDNFAIEAYIAPKRMSGGCRCMAEEDEASEASNMAWVEDLRCVKADASV